MLAQKRGVRNHMALPPLGLPQILAWADAHHQRTGSWPHARSGPIAEAPGETWCGVALALQRGIRGLPGGTTLPRLLQEQRGHRHSGNLAPYTLEQILNWADSHLRRTGRWPTQYGGPIPEAPGETWEKVNGALFDGLRCL